jgi:hypothetical protein
MNTALPLLLTLLGASLLASEPLVTEPLPIVASPDFNSPLNAEWKIAHGTYDPKDGILLCAEKPENKHAAVLWHQVGWNTGIMECEFRFDGSKVLILGCDGNTPGGLKHVGRLVISPKLISIAEDSTKPSHTLTKCSADLKPGTWHKLRLEWKGDQIAVQLNDITLHARHSFLATPKARSWIAVGGQTTSIRGLKISGK